MNKETLIKELIPLVEKVKGFKNLVGKNISDTELSSLINNGLSPIYGEEDGSDTDLYFPSISNEDASIVIKFSIETDLNTDSIVAVNTDDCDILTTNYEAYSVDLDNIDYDKLFFNPQYN